MKFSLALLALSALSACAASPNAAAPASAAAPALLENPAMTQPSPPSSPHAGIRATGTVRYLDLEGGFWGIVADDGRKFDPMGLDARFQKEGLRVRFEATAETDMMSTRMWGTMVRLTKIEPIE
jgi:hypothetical protein